MLGVSAISRPDFIGDITMATTNSRYQLGTNGGLIPNNRFLYGMTLRVQCRMTNPGSGGPTGVRADAPFSLIERIDISGFHRPRGQQELFYSLRGSEIYNLAKMYGGTPPFMRPASAPGWPTFRPSLSITPDDVNDIEFVLPIIFPPEMVPIEDQANYILDAPNYDQLKMDVYFADSKSVFSGQTTEPTFSALGSATGSPRVRVHGMFVLGGQALLGVIPARVWRYSQELTAGDINGSGTVTGSRLFNIPRGNKIRSILMKTGVKATTASSGNNVYDSLSDDIFTNVKVYRGLNNAIRNFVDFREPKIESHMRYQLYPPDGHGLIDFVLNGRLSEVFDTVGLIAGPSGDTDCFVAADVAGAANQAAIFVVQEIRGVPRRLKAA